MNKKISILILTLVCMGFGGCSPSLSSDRASAVQNPSASSGNDNEGSSEPPPDDEGSDGSGGRVSFYDMYERVIVPRCVECHGASGGVNLEGQSRVQNELEAIRRVVLIEERMPPMEDGPLTSEERELLKKWIEQEAP